MVFGHGGSEFVVSYSRVDDGIVVDEWVIDEAQASMGEVQADQANARCLGVEQVVAKATGGSGTLMQSHPFSTWDFLVLTGDELSLWAVPKSSSG